MLKKKDKKKALKKNKKIKSKIYACIIAVSSIEAVDTWLAIEQGFIGIEGLIFTGAMDACLEVEHT